MRAKATRDRKGCKLVFSRDFETKHTPLPHTDASRNGPGNSASVEVQATADMGGKKIKWPLELNLILLSAHRAACGTSQK